MGTRVVVAIGIRSFAYANRASPEIITNDVWPQQIGSLKTNTVLQYDSNYQNVIKWGNPALAQKQPLVKKHYLRESGKLIKETISTRWHGLKFFEHVLLVISIPTEFDDRAKDTKRKCLYNAGLTNSKESNKIEFTTEPEAAAIYCMRNLEEQNKQNIQSNRNV
ncbi:unnamed protein product [Rhizophagus irregularis]|nr:unnamed protein product [Rhizophagus irregularis]